MKTCTKCKQTKEFTAFTTHVLARDGYASWCKACMAARNRERYAEYRKLHPAAQRGRVKAHAADGHAVCGMCHKEKLLEAFYEHLASSNGRTTYCKECMKMRSKARYDAAKQKHQEKINGQTEREATQESSILDIRGAGAEGLPDTRQITRAGGPELNTVRPHPGGEGSDTPEGQR